MRLNSDKTVTIIVEAIRKFNVFHLSAASEIFLVEIEHFIVEIAVAFLILKELVLNRVGNVDPINKFQTTETNLNQAYIWR